MNDYTYDYNFINTYNGTRSPTGTVQFDYTTAYFWRSLYQRLMSVIDFNLPTEWNKGYFQNVLFGLGFIAVIDTPKFGVIPQICTLSGYGIYKQPTEIIVAQPLVEFRGDIGDRCQLIRLTPDFRGVCDIVDHYAQELAEAYTSVSCSLKNSRTAFVAIAKNKAAAETLKVVNEQISSGEPQIVVDKTLRDDDLTGKDPIWTEAFNVRQSYAGDLLLDAVQTILSQFDREVGIPSVDEKKERLISSEVSQMAAGTCARLHTWSQFLDETIGRTNDLFPGLNLSYTTAEERSAENVTDPTTDNDRSL